jgi:outer membrane protein assembly factor BamB
MTVFAHAWTRWTLLGVWVLALAACSSSPNKPQPAALPSVSGQQVAQKVWSANIGPVTTPLFASVHGAHVALASTPGQVVLINASTGQDVWRLQLGSPIQAGVGGDGQRFAVITRNNEVVAIEAGKVVWRHRLPAMSFTAPLVAGGRVFVLTADRTVTALDGSSGQKLWSQQRTGDPLVLQQAGLLISFADTLLAGWGGRLAALNPNTGAVRWETLVGSSRGTNEVERLVDLDVDPVEAAGVVYSAGYHGGVSAVSVLDGDVLWRNENISSHTGLSNDWRHIYLSDSESHVWQLDIRTGSSLWQQQDLHQRSLSAPAVYDNYVVVGDFEGYVHWLSTSDGRQLARVKVSSSPVSAKPIVVENIVYVYAQDGTIAAVKVQ